MSKKGIQRTYQRFPVSYRLEHILLILSFTTLAVTGLVQKFHTGWFSEWFVAALGGVETVRIVHRVAAAIMVLESIYHVAVAGYRVFVLRTRLSMLPGIGDVTAALGALLYNLGLRKARPLEGRYNFVEKAEYWALVWGTIVMGITGFMLWNPIATARILPGEVIPAAKAAHGAEAILAAAAIVIWHFYHAHVKFFNKSMFTGQMTEAEMVHEHPLELAEIKAGTHQQVVAPERIARRRRIYLPVSVISSILLVAGLIYFMTFEETAIATVPPIEDVTVFAPLTPTPFPTPLPTATPLPEADLTWADGVADLFAAKCGACHTTANPLGGLDVTGYETLLAGGANGPGIVPGDPDASTVITRQVTGDHPGQFTTGELVLIREWIAAEAPRAHRTDSLILTAGTLNPNQATAGGGIDYSGFDDYTVSFRVAAPEDHFPDRCATCHHGDDCGTCHGIPADHYLAWCSSCHNTQDWRDATVDHEALVRCELCHVVPDDHYPGQCSDCHRPVAWSGIFFSHSGFSDCATCHTALPTHYEGQCANCHNPSAWDDVAFDHTGFTDCLGCHSAQRPADHYDSPCAVCHNTADWSQVAVDHAQLPSCASCHQAPAGHWLGQCSVCHATNTWEGASFAHTGSEDCAGCHQAPAGHWLGQCSNCHTTSTWEDASFAHTGSEDCSGCHQAPAGHWLGQCSICHATSTWEDASFAHTGSEDCSGCHQAPAGHWPGQCSICHATSTWEDASFAHTGSEDCSGCHQAPAGHWPGQCSICHATNTWGGASFAHTGSEDCSGCHQAPAGHWPGQCSNCHTVTSWGDVDFDHTNYTDCKACHSDDRPDGHPGAQCSNCHTTESWGQLIPTPTPPSTPAPSPTPVPTPPPPKSAAISGSLAAPAPVMPPAATLASDGWQRFLA